MEKFSVKKSFEISYAHRLLNHKGACANLHGHNAKIEIKASSSVLDDNKMVIDFGDIKEKAGIWLKENLDHKTILSKKDPLVEILKKEGVKLFLTDENPTAEILCKIIYSEISKLGLNVSKVKFFENESSSAAYAVKNK